MALIRATTSGSGGGGLFDVGTFQFPVSADGTKKVDLPFTPKKVAVYYLKTGTTTKAEAIVDDDISFFYCNDTGSGNPSSQRISLATTTNGFNISFSGSDTSTWQANDAYYIAVG